MILKKQTPYKLYTKQIAMASTSHADLHVWFPVSNNCLKSEKKKKWGLKKWKKNGGKNYPLATILKDG